MKKLPTFGLVIIPFIFFLLITSCKKSSNSTLPLIATTQVTSIDSTTAVSGGDVFSDGGDPVTARGVCWSKSSQLPTIADLKTTDGSGTGTFASSLASLTKGTLYYVRAYATNVSGTAYGPTVSFYTLGPVVHVTTSVVTLTATNVTATTATLNGSIDASFDLANAVFEYGLATDYGTTVPASLKSMKITKVPNGSKNSKATVLVTVDISGLAPYTVYHFRLDVVSTTGSSFGDDSVFTTTY